MNLLLILLGKFIVFFSQTFNLGSGSTWPGHIALNINKNFIKQLTRNSKTKIVLIAGTNGKTTTSKLIRHMLETNGKTVFQNEAGANLLNGIASTLLLNTNVLGKITADYAIFEVDENSLPPVLQELTPDTVILLNLFRDQLDRYGEVNAISSKWAPALETLPQSSMLILNADDPEIAFLGTKTKAKTFYFGLNDPKLSQTAYQHASDSTYCPQCGAKLVYSDRYFSHIGIWKCNKCGLKRPTLTIEKSPYYPLPGIYSLYNTNAAVLFAEDNNVSNETIEQTLKDFKPAFGRQEMISYKNRTIQLFLSKNPTSMNMSLRTVKELGGKYLLIILNDRIPDGRDVSWIWDVDFETYLSKDQYIHVSGDRVYDMALRLKYAHPVVNHVDSHELLNNFLENLDKDVPENETLYVLPTYSAMLETRKVLTGKKIL